MDEIRKEIRIKKRKYENNLANRRLEGEENGSDS